MIAGALVLGGMGSAACDFGGGFGGGGGGNVGGDAGIFARDGRCDVRTTQQQGFTLFLPTGGAGCDGPFPVVSWGNGTATTPQTFNAFLTNVASHGFTVVASNSSNVGSGRQIDQGVDLGLAMADTGDVACVMGYSQGGGGATLAAQMNDRVLCTVAIAPDITFTSNGNARGLSQVALFAGANDNIAPAGRNAGTLFDQANPDKIFAVLNGANHLEVLGAGGGYTPAAIALLVTQLRPDDPDADAARRLINDGLGQAGFRQIQQQGTF